MYPLRLAIIAFAGTIATLSIGCATGSGGEGNSASSRPASSVDAAQQENPAGGDMGQLRNLRPAHEAALSQAHGWIPDGGGLINEIPPDATPAQIRNSVDGIGVSLGLIEGFQAQNLDIEATLEYQLPAAAGIVFRAVEEAGAVRSMYLLFVNEFGVHLVRLADGTFVPVRPYKINTLPATPYTLRAQIEGDTIHVWLNGEKLYEVQDEGHVVTGEAGIYAREGIGRFYSLHAEAL